MASNRLPSRLVATALQYGIGLALLPFEPQYGALILGHHRVVERVRAVTPGERLYVTGGVAFHTVGVVFADRLYRAFSWYDDVAHLLSGSLVAGLLVLVLSRYVDDRRRLAAIVLGALVPVGLAWEMYEFHTPRLTVYGWGDAASDIWFNVVGGTAMVGYLAARRRLRGDGAARSTHDVR